MPLIWWHHLYLVLLIIFLLVLPLTPRGLLVGRWSSFVKSVWYDVWKEAGYPTSGVMFQIKKHAKRRFKYEVLKRRHQHLLWSKFAGNFLTKDIILSGPSFVLVISPGAKTIVFQLLMARGQMWEQHLFASKLISRLTSHPSVSADALHSLDSSLFDYQLLMLKCLQMMCLVL